jgi:MFS family permease
MENQKRGGHHKYDKSGAFIILAAFMLVIIFFGGVSLYYGRTSFMWFLAQLIGVPAVFGLGFLFIFLWEKGFEKFHTTKFQYEGERFTCPRDLQSRKGIVGWIWLLVYISLFGISYYLDLPGTVRTFGVIGIGTGMCIFTFPIVQAFITPEIKGFIQEHSKSSDPTLEIGEDIVQYYILLILFTNSTLTTIVMFIYMLLAK